ncbi:MAG: YkoP family protein [Candidatus Methylomirabilales bacterium]
MLVGMLVVLLVASWLAVEELGTAGGLLPTGPLVRRLDAHLRRTCHIFEFSHSRDCLFRLALGTSTEEVILSDGTIVHRGELVGELHLWNEHIPPLGDRRSDVAWAITVRRQLAQSFQEFAAYIQTDPRFERVQAFRGEGAFGSRYSPVRLARMAKRWAFDLFPRDGAAGWWRRSADFWENLYATWLIWAYNPASLRGSRIPESRRDQFWISRDTLCRRYGEVVTASAAGRKVRRTSSPRTQAGMAKQTPQPATHGL